MSLGVYVEFFDHSAYTIPQQIIAYIGIMIGVGILKLSYVIRLAAKQEIEHTQQACRDSEEPDLSTFSSFENIDEPELAKFVRIVEPVETDMSMFVGMNQPVQPNPIMCAVI